MQNLSFRALTLVVSIAALAACGGEQEPVTPEETAPPAAPPAAATPPATPPPATAAAGNDCAGEQGLTYVCGPQGAEDLLLLGDTNWILASGMSGNGTPGHMYLIDAETGDYSELIHEGNFTQDHDMALFPACPGPLDLDSFSVHGLSIDEVSPGIYSIYTTSHGAREAIEVYELSLAETEPALAWKGCVVLPANTFANSVARLDDGGFVTTKMMDPAEGFGSLASGGITGNVYEWHPGGDVFAVEGTELSGANGIVLSEDERYMYVAAMGTREIIKFDRSLSPIGKEAVSVDISPDNIRWGEDGKLLVAGGNYVAPDVCTGQDCATGWTVIEVDAETLEVTPVGGADQNAALQGVSSALLVDGQMWVGSFNDDRVGWFEVE